MNSQIIVDVFLKEIIMSKYYSEFIITEIYHQRVNSRLKNRNNKIFKIVIIKKLLG